MEYYDCEYKKGKLKSEKMSKIDTLDNGRPVHGTRRLPGDKVWHQMGYPLFACDRRRMYANVPNATSSPAKPRPMMNGLRSTIPRSTSR